MSRNVKTPPSSTRKVTGLAVYACSDATSKGRRISEKSPKERGEYQRDRDRIVHSGVLVKSGV